MSITERAIAHKSGALRKFGIGLALVLIVAVLLPTFTLRPERTDLHILYVAAERLASGLPTYDLAEANEHTKPPLATLVFVPLTRLSFNALCRLWDFLNLLAFPLLAGFIAMKLTTDRARARMWVLLALLVLLNCWNKEIRMGQYNVLTLGLLVISAYGRLPLLQGGFALIAVLFKPTNILFLPWVARTTPDRKRWVGGFLVWAVGLCSVYSWAFGWRHLILDHREWLTFLSQSSAKHLLRFDNYSLPRWFAEHGIALLAIPVQIAGIAYLMWSLKRSSSQILNLALAGIAVVLLSPMSWFQNYTLLLPWVLLLLSDRDRSTGKARRFVVASLAVLYFGLEVFSPAVCSISKALDALCLAPLPLYALVIALTLSLRAKRSNLL